MSGRARRAIPLITLLLVAGSAAGALAQDDGLAGLVTEEVEPGVERVISDGAGNDLEEKHPSCRYDMDGVFVAPDGTVWLTTSYRGTDNDANPPGALVWALVGMITSSGPTVMIRSGPTPDPSPDDPDRCGQALLAPPFRARWPARSR